ncbi:MAG: DinB family protein [Chloroflexi bacterium]|nr:DinB family protein [Chloroflexota bacterium]
MPNTPAPLTLPQVAGLLRSGVATLRAEAEALGLGALAWHPAPGDWCVNEIIGHLLEAERRGFAGRIRLIIEQPGRTLATWNQAQVARDRNDCDRDGLELLRELESERAASVRLVLGLVPEQLQLSAAHPDVGELRVIDLLHEWVHHDRNHIKQALTNVQAYTWHNMGNTQRFSEID